MIRPVVDHLLIGAPNLELGCNFVENLLGERPLVGGSHPGRGSCNALLGLGDDAYIEVIAPDPQQSAALPLSNYLLDLPEAGLLWWAARCQRLDAMQGRLRQLGIGASAVQPGSRNLPDGSALSWRLLFATDAALSSVLPFFIAWDDINRHPAKTMRNGAKLVSLQIVHPQGELLRQLLGDEVSVSTGIERKICVQLEARNKQVILTTPEWPAPGFAEFDNAPIN